MRLQIEAFPEGTHKKAGKFDNAGRWYPQDEFRVPGTFDCGSPSRRWPYSYLKHLYTKKYARRVLREKPTLYLELHGVDPDGEEGKRFLGQVLLAQLVGKL